MVYIVHYGRRKYKFYARLDFNEQSIKKKMRKPESILPMVASTTGGFMLIFCHKKKILIAV